MSPNIKNFDELIKPVLTPGQRYVSHTCVNLLSPGENYGSIMLKVEVNILNKSGEKDVIHCVAKTCPPPGFLWKAFNTKLTFKKEINMYTTIIPTLNNFGKENGINCLMDFFAKPLGARISLDPNSDEVDENAVLLLENLIVQNYNIDDRFNGFGEEATRHILKDLATFHASVIAYKSAKPNEFQAKILPHLKNQFHYEPNEDSLSELIKHIQKAASGKPDCVPYLSKIEDAFRSERIVFENPVKGNDIFATITHNDYWVNNTMLKYENGKVVSNKMVDFQIMEYSSLAQDVLFFLYSSANVSLLEEKVDELIRYYYDEFIKTLIKLQHDISEYSFESMMEEFALMAKNAQFTHILFILNPMMTRKGKATELSEIKDNSLVLKEEILHENYKSKVQFVLLDFVRKGWI